MDAPLIDTERFTDLGKLNLLMVVRFLAPANFYHCPAALKFDIPYENSQEYSETWLLQTRLLKNTRLKRTYFKIKLVF